LQSERVAAWRELARRLAHELKNPLFPLQITVENLQRARKHYPEQFDEVFTESMTTLLAEISNLKSIIGRFSDFSKMPAPELQIVRLNGMLREITKLFEPQIASHEPKINVSMELSSDVAEIDADPVLLRRVFENLILNAIDAMPQGGTLSLRTGIASGVVWVEISDTGVGLTPEERERIFTPYYTSKQHGTGLGLAIVQSVVSDHHGTISVRSEPGKGATFEVQLPERSTQAPVTSAVAHANV
jgi:two-component system nitrogen regulation sensor histidine kinase NtrY